MRILSANQTRDPARGSFLIRPRMTKEYANGSRVFVAPTEPVGNGDQFETFSNSIEFQPVEDK